MTSLKERIGEELTCSICLGTFQDPRILDCLHTFCRTCLEHIFDHIPCPTCRSCTPVVAPKDLKINFTLANISNILHSNTEEATHAPEVELRTESIDDSDDEEEPKETTISGYPAVFPILAFDLTTKTFKTVSNENWTIAKDLFVVNKRTYVLGRWIYQLHDDGAYKKASKEFGWSVCRGVAMNDQLYLISSLTGRLMHWSPLTCKYKYIGTEVWRNYTAFCGFKNCLYIFSKDVYKVDVSDGSYAQITHDGQWGSIRNAFVAGDSIYCICTKKKRLLRFDEHRRESVQVSSMKIRYRHVLAPIDSRHAVLFSKRIISKIDLQTGETIILATQGKRVTMATYSPHTNSVTCM